MYRYHYNNTKHVHVPLQQYKTCTCTTTTIQNIYMYHYNNTKHLHVPLGRANIKAYFQNIVFQDLIGRFGVFKPANQHNSVVVATLCFAVATFLIVHN